MDKRYLKEYVRYDGTGRIVPGSNILNRIKPKVGKWVEKDAYECCNYTTTTTTTVPCISSQYQYTVTQANINDATGNTGIEVLGPNGNLYITTNRFWYSTYVACDGSGGGSGGSIPNTETVCVSQAPYVWYFKNNAVVLINTVNIGPCP